MRIGYFGGSFDPPHCGHLAAAQAAAEAFALDTVLFVPTASQPLKLAAATAGYVDRLAMVGLLCAGEPRFQAARLEAPRDPPAPHYTVETLEKLRDDSAPGDELFVLLGADAFRDLPRWRSPERLFELATLVVLSRPTAELDGEPLASLVAALPPAERERVHLLETLDDPNASSAVRAALADGQSESLLEALPAAVLKYIRDHRLYLCHPG